ncbi:hypothetical protein HanHA89_Chr01g0003011 [Helianthus annuus]|nr:hypothetical protein HanHA89_Chr01g0003011 [Helianthus annuus]
MLSMTEEMGFIQKRTTAFLESKEGIGMSVPFHAEGPLFMTDLSFLAQ